MNDQDFALVVGINNYPALPKLNAAEGDAKRFHAWLLEADGGGLPEQNVIRILSSDYGAAGDPFDAQPIKHDIDRALYRLGAGSSTRKGRRLYIYFSGHGLGLSFDEVALLMANAAPNMFGLNLGIGEYRAYFRHAAPFDEVVIFLDCCRDLEDRAAPQPPVFKLAKRENAPLVRDFLAYATRLGKKAYEPEALGQGENRGLFTEALLEGLRGKAADPSTGQVTAASLGSYLSRRIPLIAQERGKVQTPEFEGNAQDLIFGSLKPDWLRLKIQPPAGWIGDVLLLDGYNAQKYSLAAVDAPWEVSLPAGLYQLVHTLDNQRRYFTVLEGKEEPEYVPVI